MSDLSEASEGNSATGRHRSRLLAQVLTALRRADRFTTQSLITPSSRRRLLLVALVLFVVIGAASIASLPGDLSFTWWPAAVLVLVAAPAIAFVNAAEYRVMAGMNGYRVRWGDALDISVTAAGANLLPLPGGVAIRTQALRGQGATTKHALGANFAAAGAWMSCGCITAGMLMLVDTPSPAAWALSGGGGSGLVVVGVVLRTLGVRRVLRVGAALVWVEAVKVVISGLRLWLAFELVGLSASLAQCVAVSAAHIIAAMVGIFPAGLGLREALAGVIGAVVGIGAPAAVVASAADRVTGMVGSALIAGAILVVFRRRRASEPLPVNVHDNVDDVGPVFSRSHRERHG